MSLAQTAAGTKVFIGDAMPDGDLSLEATWDPVTWTEIAEVTELPEYGRAYQVIEHNPLATRRTSKRKGSYNEGSATMQMAKATADPGQTALKAARDVDDTMPFKVEEDDAPDGGTPTTQYFGVQVVSYTTNYGTVNQIKMSAAALELDTDILEVAAAEAV